MTYEELQIANEGLNIKEMDLSDVSDLKGLYIDGNIAINSSLSETEKACVLAEELGHHYTSSGNILDLENVRNRKQEQKARLWAYNQQIGLVGLVNIFKHGCQDCTEAAEFLNVTEDFFNDTLECYRNKYGRCTTVDNYIIFFEPRLAVMEKL